MKDFDERKYQLNNWEAGLARRMDGLDEGLAEEGGNCRRDTELLFDKLNENPISFDKSELVSPAESDIPPSNQIEESIETSRKFVQEIDLPLDLSERPLPFTEEEILIFEKLKEMKRFIAEVLSANDQLIMELSQN